MTLLETLRVEELGEHKLEHARKDVQHLFIACVAFLRARGNHHTIYITSVLRDGGVHGTGRALDFAFSRDAMVRPANMHILLELRAWVNTHFPYTKSNGTPSYTCIYRQETGSASGDSEHLFHVHLQMSSAPSDTGSFA